MLAPSVVRGGSKANPTPPSYPSCSRRYFRCYSPVAFGKKTDKEGEFIRKWVPELRKLPAKYIYEPWTAPKEVLKAAGVKLGEGEGCNYPQQCVDHAAVSKANMSRIAVVYAAFKENGGNVAGNKAAARTVGDLNVKPAKKAKKATKKKKMVVEDSGSDSDEEFLL